MSTFAASTSDVAPCRRSCSRIDAKSASRCLNQTLADAGCRLAPSAALNTRPASTRPLLLLDLPAVSQVGNGHMAFDPYPTISHDERE